MLATVWEKIDTNRYFFIPLPQRTTANTSFLLGKKHGEKWLNPFPAVPLLTLGAF